MKSYFSKILFLSLILLSQIEKVHLIEDEDLKIEDEKKNPEIKKKKFNLEILNFKKTMMNLMTQIYLMSITIKCKIMNFKKKFP